MVAVVCSCIYTWFSQFSYVFVHGAKVLVKSRSVKTIVSEGQWQFVYALYMVQPCVGEWCRHTRCIPFICQTHPLSSLWEQQLVAEHVRLADWKSICIYLHTISYYHIADRLQAVSNARQMQCGCQQSWVLTRHALAVLNQQPFELAA